MLDALLTGPVDVKVLYGPSDFYRANEPIEAYMKSIYTTTPLFDKQLFLLRQKIRAYKMALMLSGYGNIFDTQTIKDIVSKHSTCRFPSLILE